MYFYNENTKPRYIFEMSRLNWQDELKKHMVFVHIWPSYVHMRTNGIFYAFKSK